MTRETAARFSFLLSLPIIAGAGLFKGVDVARAGLPPGFSGPFLWGMLASALSGFLVIAFLLAYLRRRSYAAFAVYRIAAAAVIFAVIAFGIRSATV